MLTKKHFKVFAQALGKALNEDTKDNAINLIQRELEELSIKENENFNIRTFREYINKVSIESKPLIC